MSSYEKRLNKYISDSGYCSRRFADKLIEKNRVTINGKVPELGTKVVSGDRVCIDGNEIKASASNHTDRVYIAYNKPIGITCTTERQVKGNIIDAIGHTKRIFPIGRLDKPSEGLIFLTSDGDIVNKILRAENAHDKEYIVKVDKPISERFVERMSKGVPILGTITKPCIVKHESKYVFRIILTQGLNRQIRRMCEYLDYEVTELQRSRIMNVELGNLRSGEWRDLTTSEMAEINTAVAGSRKTALGDDFTAVEITEAASTEAEIIDDDHAAVEVNAEVEKVAITDSKHASKTIASKSPAASRTLTRIDVKKPTATSSGKKRLSLKKKS
ncbi:23S rRNA pseudouridine(2604) synthase RluF [Colwellia sp. MB3u-4]|uniref:23S rRNA pseudouridine(2604) synthase RluF n=1 Tax=Colwellia sp. MB3u-4 TaxID=2759822 RepID=UPI0015F49C6E|nr:23S rRNA pseudouridine(2604) synthase RluF [Colwellia sp. MB3u-4]MBA6288382.1 23S rRNA pseudouridine(2604) synthase RluF [Colwellia sp. MB3u-4]